MSKKFEELLDLLVNEEMDKANELFHEIVVEKSREIYENMIAEEAEEEDESDEDSVDEAMDDEEDDESIEEETTLEIGGDAADDFVSDVQDDDAMGMGDEEMDGDDMAGDMGDEGAGTEEERINDLEDALEQLKAEFEALMSDEAGEEEHNDGEEDPEFGDEDGEDESEEDGEEEDGNPFAKESVREYVEKVTTGHGVERKGQTDSPDNSRSPVSTAKGKPTTGATAHNILGSKSTEAGGKGGQGLVGSTKGEFTKGVEKNITGSSKTKMPQGDTLNKVAAGHGAEKKGTGESGAYTKSPADRRQ